MWHRLTDYVFWILLDTVISGQCGHSRLYLITRLDCGLDCWTGLWTGLLDWIDGLDC